MRNASKVEDSHADPAYGWVVVGAVSVSVTVSYGVLTYAFGVVLVPMERELGWSRLELTGAFSLALGVWALAGIAVGVILDRFGPRLPLVTGSVLGGALVLMWSQVRTLPELYFVFAGIGVAMAALLYNSVFTVVTKWFQRRRREALTTVALAGAFASLIFSPLTAGLTAQFGWRSALVVLAVVLALTATIYAGTLRQPPISSDRTNAVAGTLGLRTIFSSRRFWLLTVALALGSFTWSAIVVQLVPILIDRGHGLAFAALTAGIVGVCQLPGRLLFILFARILGDAQVLSGGLALTAISLGLLLFGQSDASVLAFAVIFGASAGLLTLVGANLPAELFGPWEYGKVSSLMYAGSNGARAIAPFCSAAIASLPGANSTLLFALILVSMVAAILGTYALRAEP